MDILTIETPSLGDRSYVVTDGATAAVIDPQRDIDRVFELTRPRDLTITHVLETHIHNDYVSGGLELARRTGATYVLNGADETFFDFHPVTEGDELTVGELSIRVVHTPGHTPTHVAFVVTGGATTAVFTGGSLLYGAVGRTDLVSRAATRDLTRAQFATAQRLVRELPDDAVVLPTHGFGSFCSSAAPDDRSGGGGVEMSTIGEERDRNLAFTVADEDEFVATLLAGFDAYPRYYAYMGPRNRVGPEGVELSAPVAASPAELEARMLAGEWVVDLRSRTAYARDHVTGTVNIGLDGSFVTYLAWLIPWSTPVTLVGDTPGEVAYAQRDLARVGIDRPTAHAVGGVGGYGDGLARSSYRIVDFEVLAEARADGHDPPHVLDVRRNDERRELAVAGSQHIPIHELLRRIDEVPADREVWIHCASGYRASIAASMLTGRHRVTALVDDDDHRIAELGLDRPTGDD